MKYILAIEPTVNIWTNEKECLFYNTLDKKHLYYNDESIRKIAVLLLSDENNYIIELSSEFLKSYEEFLNDIISNNFGFIESLLKEAFKPVQLFPIASVQRSRELNKKDFENLIGNNILKYLKEISIYFNSCFNTDVNPNIHKQFTYPIIEKEPKELNKDILFKFLEEIKFSKVQKINIVGHDLFNYKAFQELIRSLASLRININYFLSLSDLEGNIEKILEMIDPLNVFIFTLFEGFDVKGFENLLNLSKENPIHVHLRFAVSNETQFKIFTNLIEETSISNYSFVPYFNEENVDFFSKNIYLTFDEVLDLKNNQVDIHQKEFMNPLLWGKLSLLPDNKIYTDLNANVEQGMEYSSLKEIMYKVLTGENHWRLTRNMVKGCKDCVARFICPPLSNYELLTKHYTSCEK